MSSTTTTASRKRPADEAGLDNTNTNDKKQATNGSSTLDDDEDAEPVQETLQRDAHGNIICPYLDTIDRKLLDFDFEKLCSVTLAHMNVYACLVCGKYFQGRGKKSHAYFHALEQDHHVFINLETEQIYCLPDGYQVIDSSLEDIRYNLHPRFTPEEAAQVDAQRRFSHALDGTDYLPGTVGLNNIKSTDWLNVTIQALIRVPMFRTYWLVDKNWKHYTSGLVKACGELMAKMYNPRSFKSHVSPHELLQAISAASQKRFRIGQQSDPLQFLSWFLNTLHKDVGGTKKPNSSIIHQTFQGEIEIHTKTPVKKQDEKDKEKEDEKKKDEKDAMEDDKEVEYTESTTKTNFLYLSLSLPSAPLFKDAQDKTLIPQIPLFDLLKKFDGQTVEYAAGGVRRTYQITRLPRYLIIHAQRFQDNNWFTEKNPTLINFPLRNLDMRPYLKIIAPTIEQLQHMPIAKLKEMGAKKKLDMSGALEKAELIAKVHQAYSGEDLPTRYDLIANIVHEGKPDKGSYKIHILQKGTETWYEIQDLHVWTTETMPQLVALSETYIQIYERK